MSLAISPGYVVLKKLVNIRGNVALSGMVGTVSGTPGSVRHDASRHDRSEPEHV
jgi:hypothetical protein